MNTTATAIGNAQGNYIPTSAELGLMALQQASNQQIAALAYGTQNTISGANPFWGHTGIGLTAQTLIVGSVVRHRVRQKLAIDRAFAIVKRCLHRQTPDSINGKMRAAASLGKMARENGQQGLYEEMTATVANESLSMRLVAAGFGNYLARSTVMVFANRCAPAINLTPIVNFGRPIPPEVGVKLKRARETKLFSDFTVLHAGTAWIKTAAQKIREKDPILFGTVAAQPDRLYFIADWVDEQCHLTLSELLVDPNFTGSLESVDVDENKAVGDTAERKRLLDTARTSTWQANERAAQSIGSPALRWPRYSFHCVPGDLPFVAAISISGFILIHSFYVIFTRLFH